MNSSIQDERDLLAISAPLAWDMAPRLCCKDPVTGIDCSWSHGFWQYLRLLGLAGDPGNHSDFFRSVLAESGVDGPALRVLVCGSADYAMLALLCAAYGKRNPAPEITVIDRCETPLWLNRWYAERKNVKIETQCCDILEYRTQRPFDLLCTHSFFSYFPSRQRAPLLEKWHALLRPGGKVVTANRLRADATGVPAAFSPLQVSAFRNTVSRLSHERAGLPGISDDVLLHAAELYASTVTAWPVRSSEDIRNLFEDAGFRIDQLACVHAGSASNVKGPATGPTAPADARYVHVVASRV
jgi:SAM-dependent methyltransferase